MSWWIRWILSYNNSYHNNKFADTIAHQIMQDTVRIDKWLWAARFFKTRSLAQEAIVGGKVTVNNQKVKPSKGIQIDDILSIRRGAFVYIVTVRRLAEKRLSAVEAQQLYEESEQSIAERELRGIQLKAQSLYSPKTDKRPDKKSRRQLINIKKS